ncbi:MAG: hypothetical protein HY831_02280 [Candidatus Aenigmarchaeota archaeon]|nr:hypothetical protein [Candidatus Aenigmarchaeota archaeon]
MKLGVKIVLGIVIVLVIFLVSLELVRVVSPRWIDDISPGIQCDSSLMETSDVFFVIPKFNNHSIAFEKEWCEKILKMNKTLVMHGVYHTYNELLYERDDVYFQEGIDAFEQCFGVVPTEFKPSHLAISDKNMALISKKMKVDGYFEDILHKTYHCNDTGIIPNNIVDLV